MEDGLNLANNESMKRKNWILLLIFGLLLNIFVSFTSNLGLDTHVHMSRNVEFTETGEANLPWGHTRPLDPMANDPDYSPSVNIGWHRFLPDTINEVHVLGLAFMILLLISTIILFKIEGALNQGIAVAAIVAIHPTFIFATGRAFPEAIVAIFTILLMIGLLLFERWPCWKGIIASAGLSGFSMGAILFVKGINPMYSVIVFILVLLWHSADRFERLWRFTRSPLFSVKIGIGGTLSVLLLVGIISDNGTFSAVGDQPIRYVSAFLIASIDALLIYGVFGMILWPFIGDKVRKLRAIESHSISGLVGLISTLSTAITFYIAALWTYESELWNSDWPWIMWTMGNNGRYISMLMVPCFLLLFRIQQIDTESYTPFIPGIRFKSMVIGICLIIPLSLLTTIHGQTMWTDDAAEILSENMGSGDDFLFVHEETLGMHYLYTFHTHIENVNEKEIMGHWRAPNSEWTLELFSEEKWENRGNLSSVQWVVISPGIEWEQPPDDWGYISGQADFMNGGGEWKIYTTKSNMENLIQS